MYSTSRARRGKGHSVSASRDGGGVSTVPVKHVPCRRHHRPALRRRGSVRLRGGQKKEEEKTTVHIKDLKYTPPTITIKAGQAITWLNDDDKDHTVVADDGSFESDNLGNGEKFKFTFKKKGKFSYHCKYHPREKGVVIVTD